MASFLVGSLLLLKALAAKALSQYADLCDDGVGSECGAATSLLQTRAKKFVLPEETLVLADTLPSKSDLPGYRFTFEHGGEGVMSFEVLTGKGGLVQAFSLNGTSIVLNRPWPDQLDGSTFWPSPQSWGGSAWPPPPQIDVCPSIASGASPTEYSYEATIDASTGVLTLTSDPAPQVELIIKKHFSVDRARGAMVLDYEIINTKASPASWAPWEITRVAPHGMTFFATGNQPVAWRQPGFPIHELNGTSWFHQKPEEPSGGKLTSDTSAGFLAHTDGQLLLTKCFQRIAPGEAAPGEGQIEIYDGGDYVEVETQGAFQEISPNGSLGWRVLWFLRAVPPFARARVGNQALAEFAKGLCDL